MGGCGYGILEPFLCVSVPPSFAQIAPRFAPRPRLGLHTRRSRTGRLAPPRLSCRCVLLSDADFLSRAQRRKIESILTGAGNNADALLLDVRPPRGLPDGTVCLSVLARMNKRKEIQDPRACFLEPDGRHRWRSTA